MWKITLRFLLQNNNNCREKHDCCISLHKIQTRAMIPNLFYMRTPDYAAFNEKRYQWRSQTKIGGGKYLTLGEQQYFCFGRRFSMQKWLDMLKI